MSNNNEDHIWITSQTRRAWGLGATMLSVSQMCKPYARTEIKKKKETVEHERASLSLSLFLSFFFLNFAKTVNGRYR